ncbi:MAG: cytochrome c oxidase assembly factor Coa1 family protein [Dokdonia sp.]|jgi:hypothetical protein|nr:hypothetical protein [Cytophagaceae bacterium]
MNTLEGDHRNWWQRNWKWALPTGGCLTIIIIFVAMVAYGVYKVTDKFSNNSSIFAFAKVIKTVQENEEVGEVLGKPIEIRAEGYDPMGSPEEMNLEIDLDGTAADGTLKVIARKIDEQWVYELITVTVDDSQQVIDLTDQIEQ